MNRKKRIKKILSKNFTDWIIEVHDTSILHKGHYNFDGKKETHFSIILNSSNQNKELKLNIHRKINKLLADEFNLGLHSLEIKIVN